MDKNQLKHHIKNQAILSTAIDTTYPDKCFIRLSRVKALIDSELSHNVKNSTDNQRQAFSNKLKAQTKILRIIMSLMEVDTWKQKRTTLSLVTFMVVLIN